MNLDIQRFNNDQEAQEKDICQRLCSIINDALPEAESKIWHKHPVWFLEGNPIVGYSKLKAGIRLMFWSGASFGEQELKPGTGKFKDASRWYESADEINPVDVRRWIAKSKVIQWDYKNIYQRKGELIRLK